MALTWIQALKKMEFNPERHGTIQRVDGIYEGRYTKEESEDTRRNNQMKM